MNDIIEILNKVKSGEISPELAKKEIQSNIQLLLSDYAKDKLNFINGHSIARDFPNTQPNLEWCGAVIDLLVDMNLNKLFLK